MPGLHCATFQWNKSEETVTYSWVGVCVIAWGPEQREGGRIRGMAHFMLLPHLLHRVDEILCKWSTGQKSLGASEFLKYSTVHVRVTPLWAQSQCHNIVFRLLSSPAPFIRLDNKQST